MMQAVVRGQLEQAARCDRWRGRCRAERSKSDTKSQCVGRPRDGGPKYLRTLVRGVSEVRFKMMNFLRIRVDFCHFFGKLLTNQGEAAAVCDQERI